MSELDMNDKKAKTRIQLTEEIKEYLSSVNVIGREIEVDGMSIFPKSPEKSGCKGVVWKGLNDDSEDVAIKFVIYQDYMDKSYLQERRLAVRLKKYSNYFSIFDRAGIVEFELPTGEGKKFICFVESWVDGWTLEDYIKSHGITAKFIVEYVKQMSNALNILNVQGLAHDDLHTNNVMIAKPLPGLLSGDGKPNEELTLKVIDMGSLKPKERQCKPEDDHLMFVKHVIFLYNALKRKQPKSIFDLRFLKNIKPLIFSMLDDPTRALRDPGSIQQTFISAWERAEVTDKSEDKIMLTDPFEYIAAEHIVDDRLLIRLFAESCPWLKKVAGPDPILLTGPRGCGKSMVFRRLSLRALLNKSQDDINESQIAGFYLSCSADMRNRFAWITPNLARRFKNEIVHYFNLLIAREVSLTFYLIAKRNDRVSLLSFGETVENALYDFLMVKINASTEERFRLQGANRMRHLVDVLDRHLDNIYSCMLEGKSLAHTTSEAFVTDLSRFLVRNIQFCESKRPAFLIDDYSTHRVPKCVQEILNLIIWDRQPTHVFKISSEKYGVERKDLLEATSDPTREMREIDAGYEYLDLTDKKQLKAGHEFAKELLSNRLVLASYLGTPEKIIGHSHYQEGSLGNVLRKAYGTGGRHDNIYHGLETIADTCSGDISVLLEVYRRIFAEGHVTKETRERIKSHIQHKSIVAISRIRLDLIKSYPKFGGEIYKIVHAFGVLSRSILQYGELMGKENVVPQTTRIEVEQSREEPEEILNEDQQELVEEMIRRAIFIEMESGRSRHKNVLTLRWQLRRIFAPAFGTSLAKTTAIKWKPKEFKDFLLNPEEVCENEFEKRWKRPTYKTPLLDGLGTL